MQFKMFKKKLKIIKIEGLFHSACTRSRPFLSAGGRMNGHKK